VVEARGVLIATVLAALVMVGLVAYAAITFAPSDLREQACEAGDLPASQCN
jgi:hypothetical protein